MSLPSLSIRYDEHGAFRPPLCAAEHLFNRLTVLLLYLSLAVTALLPVPVVLDVMCRQCFGVSLGGVMEIETQGLVLLAFAAMPYVTATASHIAIDLLYTLFGKRAQLRTSLLGAAVCACISGLLAVLSLAAGMDSIGYTSALHLPERWFYVFVGGSLAAVCAGMLFQLAHVVKDMAAEGDYAGMAGMLVLAAALFLLPFLYKAGGIRLSKLAIGAVGFALLFGLLFLRISIGLVMAAVGTLGLLCIMRTPGNAFSLVAEVPYKEAANFVLVAVPMFMLMGEIMSVSGISRDMFDCFNKWLGRMPGGLACATVTGCAGFGAICGESLPTVIAMSTVALPEMRKNGYAPSLACGSLAAGGTLGILIPPSMGFVWYSIMTEESIGALFVAGILPGMLLTSIFVAIILFRVWRQPGLAPKSVRYPLGEKIRAVLGLLPVALIFCLVVGGILGGYFTPGEGGAVGSAGGIIYALCRRQISLGGFLDAVSNTVIMTGKVFIILVGVYVLSTFFASSRIPALLARFVTSLDMNRYLVLAVVIGIYIVLGCAMNITPMMLLTLPTIYPTIQALGFDGVWFGVITVILMEAGQITPPIGLNVFTMSSLAPDVPMSTIFRGVMPFFAGMMLCVLLCILFPSIPLLLPSLLM